MKRTDPRVETDVDVDAGEDRLVLGVGKSGLGQLKQRRGDLVRLDEPGVRE